MRKTLTRLAFLTSLALMLTYPSAKVSAGDPIPLDGHAQCQACLDAAYNAWQDCVDAIGDEGDAACRQTYRDSAASCQVNVCNQ